MVNVLLIGVFREQNMNLIFGLTQDFLANAFCLALNVKNIS